MRVQRNRCHTRAMEKRTRAHKRARTWRMVIDKMLKAAAARAKFRGDNRIARQTPASAAPRFINTLICDFLTPRVNPISCTHKWILIPFQLAPRTCARYTREQCTRAGRRSPDDCEIFDRVIVSWNLSPPIIAVTARKLSQIVLLFWRGRRAAELSILSRTVAGKLFFVRGARSSGHRDIDAASLSDHELLLLCFVFRWNLRVWERSGTLRSCELLNLSRKQRLNVIRRFLLHICSECVLQFWS